jgi:hypothetical protein
VMQWSSAVAGCVGSGERFCDTLPVHKQELAGVVSEQRVDSSRGHGDSVVLPPGGEFGPVRSHAAHDG